MTHDSTLPGNLQSIKPVFINSIARTPGKIIASQIGSAKIVFLDLSCAPQILEINKGLLVPKSGVNLIAVSSIFKDGGSFSSDNNHIKHPILEKNYMINGIGSNGLYKVKACRIPPLFSAPASITADIWHCCSCHLNNSMLSKVSPTSSRTQWFEVCALAEAYPLPFYFHLPMSYSHLFGIHSNVVSPMPVVLPG